MDSDKWKVCALCRHLETVESGQEIEDIADTEYAVFHCRRLDVYRREDYLMAPVTEELHPSEPGCCPYWEPWQDKARENFLGLPDLDDLSESDDSELNEFLRSVLSAAPAGDAAPAADAAPAGDAASAASPAPAGDAASAASAAPPDPENPGTDNTNNKEEE